MAKYPQLQSTSLFFVISLRHYLLALGFLWLQLHGVGIQLVSNSLTLNWYSCRTHYTPATKVVAKKISTHPPKRLLGPKTNGERINVVAIVQ